MTELSCRSPSDSDKSTGIVSLEIGRQGRGFDCFYQPRMDLFDIGTLKTLSSPHEVADQGLRFQRMYTQSRDVQPFVHLTQGRLCGNSRVGGIVRETWF